MSDSDAQTYTLDMHIADTLRSLDHFAGDVEKLTNSHSRTVAKVDLTELVRRIRNDIEKLQDENQRLASWVADLQSGMFINCVYCGHRYGPKDEVPEHIEVCPKHRVYGEPTKEKEDEGRLSEHPCDECGAMQVYVKEINDHPDYRITCRACGRSYCVDGIDS